MDVSCPGPLHPSSAGQARHRTGERPAAELADSAGEYAPLPGADQAAVPASAASLGSRAARDYIDLGLYLAGALPEDAMRVAEEHVFGCPSCRERLYRLRDLKGMLEDRALWSRPVGAPRADAERECLNAAESLLALEDRAPARATQHLSRCVACRADLSAILDSVGEYQAQTIEVPSRARLLTLKKLISVNETGALAPTPRAEASDLMAPILLGPGTTPASTSAPVAPMAPVSATYAEIDAALAPSDRVKRSDSRKKTTASRRVLSPRPSKRTTTAVAALEVSSRRSGTPVAYASLFGIATATAAAALFVAVLSSSNVDPSTSPHSDVIARGPDAGTQVQLNPRQTPISSLIPKTPAHASVGSGSHASETPATPAREGERLAPRALDAPGEDLPGEPETAPGPGSMTPETPTPATSETHANQPGTQASGGPTAAGADSSRRELARSEPREPSPLDAVPEDDGATVDLELAQLSGGAAIRARGEDKWSNLTRRQGTVALKSGDRIRTAGGAFLSLAQGAYELSVAPKSELVIRGAKEGPVLGLAEGRVLCEVESFPDSKSLTFATHCGQFVVSGAHSSQVAFGVTADDRKAVCSVETGVVSCRATSGDARDLGAGYACALPRRGVAGEPVAASAADMVWARGLRPQHEVIYEARFDRKDLAGFVGSPIETTSLRRPGTALLFEPLEGNKYWGLSARAPKGRVKSLRAAPDVKVELTFWLERESKVLLQLQNERQGKNYKKDFGNQPAGSWQTAVVSIMDLDTYFDPGKSPVREGDVFNEIEVLAGNPGDQWKACLGELIVYRKIYR